MRILLIISVLFNVAFNQSLGDFDENGLLDILDIVSIVNQIMEGNDECIDERQYGCTDILACNYDSGATIDNGSCIYSNDQLCGECDNAGIEYPDYYEFNDYNGNSTVRYSGQVVRNIIVFSVFINIVLNILLIPELGILGAAIATSFSMVLWNVCGVIYVRYNYGFWMLPIR